MDMGITSCTLGIPCFIWEPVSRIVYLLNPILTVLGILVLGWMVIKGIIRRIV
jgi:hypothetical protein